MSGMMAALLAGEPPRLAVEQMPRPVPAPGEVLVRVKACGLCHTDLHYLDHGVPTYLKPPVVLGHEAAGVVEEVGEGVSGWNLGDRILIPAVFCCGRCEYCRAGRENLCQNLQMLGNHRHGAFAEFVTAPAKDCFPLPEEISMEGGCLIADAVSTAFHAVERSGLRPGCRVAVIGCGGIGINLVQCAALAGARVLAVDRLPEKLEWARKLGAEEVLHAGELSGSLSKALREWSEGGVEVAFEAIGKVETLQQALFGLRKGGTLMSVGYCPEEVPLALSRVMFLELQIRGSLGCPVGKFPRVIELVRRGKLKVDPLVSGVLPLDRIEEGFDRLRRSEGVRWVVLP